MVEEAPVRQVEKASQQRLHRRKRASLPGSGAEGAVGVLQDLPTPGWLEESEFAKGAEWRPERLPASSILSPGSRKQFGKAPFAPWTLSLLKRLRTFDHGPKPPRPLSPEPALPSPLQALGSPTALESGSRRKAGVDTRPDLRTRALLASQCLQSVPRGPWRGRPLREEPVQDATGVSFLCTQGPAWDWRRHRAVERGGSEP